MAVRTRFLRLQSLIAYLQSEKNGDEIFISFKGEKIAPASEKFYRITAIPVELDIELKLNKEDKWIDLELWEYNAFLPNVFLGNFKLLVDQHSDVFTAELIRENKTQAKYALTWELVSRLVEKKRTAVASKEKD
jgi:hypothetical protein